MNSHPKYLILVLAIALLSDAGTARAQQTDSKPAAVESRDSELTAFDLDFAGGTPSELVAAIQAASGRPLNAIVPPQYAEVKLPTLKMRHVNTAQLFKAMFLGSHTTTLNPDANPNFPPGYVTTEFGFKTDGKPTDQSVWYFVADLPLHVTQPQFVRFYLLTPYLEQGLAVDDVTTAIETGWKMLGHSDKAEISFHKETKLLIVVGDNIQLNAVDAALQVLKAPKPTPAPNASSEHSSGDSKAGK